MTRSEWIDYCCRCWPDLPREAIERVAWRPECRDVYRVRQAALRLLGAKETP